MKKVLFKNENAIKQLDRDVHKGSTLLQAALDEARRLGILPKDNNEFRQLFSSYKQYAKEKIMSLIDVPPPVRLNGVEVPQSKEKFYNGLDLPDDKFLQELLRAAENVNLNLFTIRGEKIVINKVEAERVKAAHSVTLNGEDEVRLGEALEAMARAVSDFNKAAKACGVNTISGTLEVNSILNVNTAPVAVAESFALSLYRQLHAKKLEKTG